MIPMLIFAGVGAVAIAVASLHGPVTRHQNMETRLDRHAVSNYRVFVYVVRSYLAANPSYTGTLSWANLKGATSTPPAMRKADMPASWKAVVAAPGSFVVCGEMSERAAQTLNQFLPQGMRGYFAGNKVVLTDSQAKADTEAVKCN